LNINVNNFLKKLNFDKSPGKMILRSQHNDIADYYFGVLKNLSADSKLDLISKLSQSLKESETKPEITLQSLFGALKSDETAEQIIENIRASRVFNRTIETL
jgi:hypothetical protein